MPGISHLRAICGLAIVAMGLSACATPSEPARTATHGPSDTSTADALVRIAHASLKAGDPGSAISMLKRAHELEPSSVSILAELGRTLGAVRAWSESVKAYRQAVALAPKDPDIRRGYGGALLKLNELALAEVEYRAALALKEEPSTLEGLAVCLDLQGRHDEAEADFRKAYQLDPQDAAIRSNLALSLALWGKGNEAVALLAPLAAAPGATPRQRQNLALVFGISGDLDQAAALSRLDLGETAVQNNLAYFETLKGLSPVMRVRAIMGAQTQPPLPDRKPIAAADLGTDRIESPSNPIEQQSAPAPHTPTHAEKSASTSKPAAKPRSAKVAKAKMVEPPPVKADAATPIPLEATKAESAQPAADTEKPVAAEAEAAPVAAEADKTAADKTTPAATETDSASAQADETTPIQPKATKAESTQPAVDTEKPVAVEAKAAPVAAEVDKAATDQTTPAASGADQPASAQASGAPLQPEVAKTALAQSAADTEKPVAVEAKVAPTTAEVAQPMADQPVPAATEVDQPTSVQADTTEHADADEVPAPTSDQHAAVAAPVGIHTYVVPTVIATWHADEPSSEAPSEPKLLEQTTAPQVEAPAASTAAKPAS